MLAASALALSASAYVLPQAAPRALAPRTTTPQALAPELPLQLLAEIVDGTGERVYGAVDAPVWVAPIAGIAAISTALLPVYAPGQTLTRSFD